MKRLSLVIGDVVALYAALLLALWLRYGGGFYEQLIDTHLTPFSVMFVLWLTVFYIAGLYDLRRLRNSLEFLKMLAVTLFVNAIAAVGLFYLIPAFGIAPKTNLLIFVVIFAIIEIIWRRAWNRIAGDSTPPNRVMLVGDGPLSDEIETAIQQNPQLGYTIEEKIDATTAAREPTSVEKLALDRAVNLVVVPRHLKRENGLAVALYRLFGRGVTVMDLANFYELVMQKIPLADLEETWFLENIENVSRFYDPLKRAIEFLFALVLGIILLPFEVLIALLVILTSRGPAIYAQERVGVNGKKFMLYKFRSMHRDAEKEGAQWSTGKADMRVTLIGRMLRASHLDELPQLWNVIKGDISFVGPRPERPEFVQKLKQEIPYYEVRLLTKPGVSGWAQLHHRADLTTDDVKQKLQYDIYYLKNRSAILDLAIIVKTIKSLFVNPK